jgi:hypothetical protein
MSRGPIDTNLTHGDHYRKGDYWMIDDLTGEKMRRSEARKTWDGFWVHKDNLEPKHPQLSVKGIKDIQKVTPVRPRPDETFIGENFLLQSETFDNASWTKTNSTVTADAIAAPDGQTTADALVDDTSNDDHSLEQVTTLIPTSALVASVVARKGSQTWLLIKVYETGDSANRINVWFNLSNGSVETKTNSGTATGAAGRINRMSVNGDIWYRCTLLGTPSTTGTTATVVYQVTDSDGGTSYVGDDSAAIYLWGAYALTGSSPSNYVKTTTSTVSNTATTGDL